MYQDELCASKAATEHCVMSRSQPVASGAKAVCVGASGCP